VICTCPLPNLLFLGKIRDVVANLLDSGEVPKYQ
jgi:hypothetical protein